MVLNEILFMLQKPFTKQHRGQPLLKSISTLKNIQGFPITENDVIISGQAVLELSSHLPKGLLYMLGFLLLPG